MDGRMEGWNDRWTNVQTEGTMDRMKEGRDGLRTYTEERVEGTEGGKVERQTDGQKETKTEMRTMWQLLTYFRAAGCGVLRGQMRRRRRGPSASVPAEVRRLHKYCKRLLL